MKPIIALDGRRFVLLIAILVVLAALSLVASSAGAAEPVRIGTKSDVTEVALEMDEATGHLFAVLRYDTVSDACFTINFSADTGENWAQPFLSCSVHGYGAHMGAAIVGGYLYVAYVDHMVVNSVELVRARTSDGAWDPVFGRQTVFSAAVGDSICHLALASNQVSFDDRLYLFAVTEGNLKFYWTDEDGGVGTEPWNEEATGVSDASCWMLEAAYNDGYWLGSGYSPVVAYQVGWYLYIWRFHGTTGAEHFLFDADAPAFEYPGSIAVSHDELEAVYWSYSYEVKSCSSATAGSSPTCRTWEPCDHVFAGDVVATPFGGFGMVYAPDNGDCLMRVKSDPGAWTGASLCSDSRSSLHGPLAIAPLQPYSPVSYGIVAVDNDPFTGTPYFVLSPVVFFDGFDSSDTSAWDMTTP